MMVDLDIKAMNAKQLEKKLQKLMDSVKDLRPVFKKFRMWFTGYFAPTNWSAKGGLLGKWPSLSPRYAAWKAKHFPGKPIMVISGSLKDSARGRSPFFKVTMTERTMRMGIYGLKHAEYMHWGTSNGVPSRPFWFEGGYPGKIPRKAQEYLFTELTREIAKEAK